MRTRLVLAAMTLAVLMTGCTVRSLYPLYTEKDVVFEPGLLGTWAEHDNTNDNWVFQKSGENSYRLISSEGKTTLEGRLVKLGGHLFLDVTPKDVDSEFSIPAHVFVKIQISGDSMRTALLNPDWVAKAGDSKTLGLSFICVGDKDKVVLTAPTKELQEFLVKHAGDEGVFGELEEYRRIAVSTEAGQ
jgi:hypothetical protein